MLHNIYVDLFFFSSAALSEDGLISDHNESETAIRTKMLTHARQNIFLCPHDRFPATATYRVANVSELDAIVSDQKLPYEFTSQYKDISFIY